MAKLVEIDIPEGSGPKPELLWRQALELKIAQGASREAALRDVICEWLVKGNAEPLLASVDELDYRMRTDVFAVIVRMLRGDPTMPFRLEPVSNRSNRPPQAGLAERNTFMAMAYYEQTHAGLTSAAALTAVANHFGSVEGTVWNAVRSANQAAKAKAEARLREEQARREWLRDFVRKKTRDYVRKKTGRGPGPGSS
jgi:hypothetical protein